MADIPARMKAVLLTGHGGFDKLQYREDVPVPEPRPGEVLIRVGAAGVNNTDINTRISWYSKAVSEGTGAGGASAGATEDSGWTGSALSLPRIQGADACGRIVALGPGVKGDRLGERVLVNPLLRRPGGNGIMGYLGSERDGAFAEYMTVGAVQAHRIESALADAELASFPCSYAAAECMLARAGLRAGERVLVTGASGGVGSAAVQLARRRAARVSAVAAAAKIAEVEALGAERVIARGASLLEALGREAVDLIVDVVGGPEWPVLLEVLVRGGRYAVVGAIAGPIVALDLRTLYLKDISIFGCTAFPESLFTDLVGYIERGEIKPLVARTYPLARIVEAQQDFLAKRHLGKLVLVP